MQRAQDDTRDLNQGSKHQMVVIVATTATILYAANTLAGQGPGQGLINLLTELALILSAAGLIMAFWPTADGHRQRFEAVRLCASGLAACVMLRLMQSAWVALDHLKDQPLIIDMLPINMLPINMLP